MTRPADVELSPQGDELTRRALTYGVAVDERRQGLLDALDQLGAVGMLDQARIDHVRGAVLHGGTLAELLLHKTVRHLFDECGGYKGVLDGIGEEAADAFDYGQRGIRNANADAREAERNQRDEALWSMWVARHELALALKTLRAGVIALHRENRTWTGRPASSHFHRRAKRSTLPRRRRPMRAAMTCHAPPTHRVGSHEVAPVVGLLVVATSAAGAGHSRPTSHGPP